MRKKLISSVLLLFGLVIYRPASAQVIIADDFNLQQDWHYDESSKSKLRASKELFKKLSKARFQKFSAFDRFVRITKEDGYSGRGVRTEINDNYANWAGKGPHTALGAQVSGTMYQDPDKESGAAYWEGNTVYIAYRNKLSDNNNWQSYDGGVVNLKMTRIEMDNGGDVIPELDNGTYKIFIDGENAYYDIYRPDNNWHTYIWKMQGQSASNKHDGYLSLHVDGKKVWEKNNVAWTGRVSGKITNGMKFRFGYNPKNGWRHGWFFLGGNVSESYKASGPRYFYWDDYIVADTLAEVDSFLGSATETEDRISPSTEAKLFEKTSDLELRLECDDMGGSGCFKTFYTNDGSLPNENSQIYTDGIKIKQASTFKFFSIDKHGNTEPIKEYKVELKSAQQNLQQNKQRFTLKDIENLISNWGLRRKSLADVNNDNIIDSKDLGIMMSNWQ
jgi:hypothetical protein